MPAEWTHSAPSLLSLPPPPPPSAVLAETRLTQGKWSNLQEGIELRLLQPHVVVEVIFGKDDSNLASLGVVQAVIRCLEALLLCLLEGQEG